MDEALNVYGLVAIAIICTTIFSGWALSLGYNSTVILSFFGVIGAIVAWITRGYYDRRKAAKP